MSTIRLHQTTTSTPEQYVAGLTDLGPCRSNLFGKSADEYFKGLGAFMRAVTELFGPEQAGVGKAKSPCRLVYGVASLPLGARVELEVIFELAG